MDIQFRAKFVIATPEISAIVAVKVNIVRCIVHGVIRVIFNQVIDIDKFISFIEGTVQAPNGLVLVDIMADVSHYLAFLRAWIRANSALDKLSCLLRGPLGLRGELFLLLW